MTNSLVLFQILTQAAGKSKDGIAQTMSGFADFVQRNGASISIVIGGDVVLAIGHESATVLEQCRRLDSLDAVALSEQGDRFVAEGRTALFKAAARANGDEAYMLITGTGTPGPALQLLFLSFLTALAALVKASAGSSQGVGSA
jgi:hypothetical protein